MLKVIIYCITAKCSGQKILRFYHYEHYVPHLILLHPPFHNVIILNVTDLSGPHRAPSNVIIMEHLNSSLILFFLPDELDAKVIKHLKGM
jgi:hypothetical protein